MRKLLAYRKTWVTTNEEASKLIGAKLWYMTPPDYVGGILNTVCNLLKFYGLTLKTDSLTLEPLGTVCLKGITQKNLLELLKLTLGN